MFNKILSTFIILFSLLSPSISTAQNVDSLPYLSGPHFFVDRKGLKSVSFEFKPHKAFVGDVMNIDLGNYVDPNSQVRANSVSVLWEVDKYPYNYTRGAVFRDLKEEPQTSYTPKVTISWSGSLAQGNKGPATGHFANLQTFTYNSANAHKFSYTKDPEINVANNTIKLSLVSDNKDYASIAVSLSVDLGGNTKIVNSIKKGVPFEVLFEGNSNYNIANSGRTNMPAIYLEVEPSTRVLISELPEFAVYQKIQPTQNPSSPSEEPPSNVPPAGSSGGNSQFPAIRSTCNDGIDNDNDGRADYRGAVVNGVQLPPDPSCIRLDSSEEKEQTFLGGLVPCTDKCDFTKLFEMLNGLLNFVLTVLIIPIFAIVLMYTGYRYLMARGKSGMHAEFKKTLWKMLKGFVLILCAWLLVKTLLVLVGYTGTTFLE